MEEDDVEGEIISAGAATAAPTPTPTTVLTPQAEARAKRKADIARIRYKALMRRARARSEAGGWSDLAGAEEDYKALAGMMKDGSGSAVVMSAADKKLIAAQLRALPPRVKAAQERETAEMWGKLKEVSNKESGVWKGGGAYQPLPIPDVLSMAVSALVRCVWLT